MKFRISLVATWLFFLAASINARATTAFVAPSSIGKRSHQLAFPKTPSTPVSLRMSELEKDELEEPQVVAMPAKNLKAKQDAFLLAYKSVSLIWYSIGVGATMLMALNLFGYSFVYTKKDGFRVDTIQQLRAEQQLKNHKYDDYYTMQKTPLKTETRPPSQLPK